MTRNPRIRPEFFDAQRAPWLPSSRLWRVVLGAYLLLGVWQVLVGHVLVAAACLLVAAAVTPRLRQVTGADALLDRWRDRRR